MSLIVSSIVEVVNEQNIIVCANDWTAEMSTIANNVDHHFVVASLTVKYC